MEEDYLSEFDQWKMLTTSDDWKVFVRLLRSHEANLNRQALLAVDKRENDVAFGYRMRALECGAILRLVEAESTKER